jgi:hypothetical protein
MLTAVQRSDRRLRHVGVRSLLALLLLYWCFTGTKVQVLTQSTTALPSLVLSLLAFLVRYWYKSANTDSKGRQSCRYSAAPGVGYDERMTYAGVC